MKGIESDIIPTDEALARLVVQEDYDPGDGPQPCVHTFRAGAFLLGAHWSVGEARAAFDRHGAREAGPFMAGMGHPIAVVDDTGPVFFEAREPSSASSGGERDDG